MARPKMQLTVPQAAKVVAAWEKSKIKTERGNIDFVAKSLNVTWQTARRWLILAGCIDSNELNDRLDRPGKKWPTWKVTIEEYENEVTAEIVEAPSWAVAFDVVAQKLFISAWNQADVERVDDTPTTGFDRQSVKEQYGETLTTERVHELVLHYAALNVRR